MPTDNNPGAGEPAPAASNESTTVTAQRLSELDLRLLARVGRFLATVMDTDLIARARTAGYTNEEHKQGWKLYRLAYGEQRSIDHLFQERDRSAAKLGKAGQQKVLVAIDEFENHWFPVTRAVIRRVVPREQRDAFTEAFFHDLAQQPLGPGVINSVSTFLQRVDGLLTSKLPGAAKVRSTLAERGLTEAKVKEERALLDLARNQEAPAEPAPALLDAAAIAKEQQDQLDALEDLRDWFNDWSTTLRRSYNDSERRRLGLRVRTAPTSSATDEDKEDDKEAEDDA